MSERSRCKTRQQTIQIRLQSTEKGIANRTEKRKTRIATPVDEEKSEKSQI